MDGKRSDMIAPKKEEIKTMDCKKEEKKDLYNKEKPLIHYWKDNVITLFDPITKTKKMVILDKSINHEATSISVGNKIFLIGGSPCISDMHEVDFVSNTLIPKKSMLTPKYHHTLCNANDYIYSIGGFNGLKSI